MYIRLKKNERESAKCGTTYSAYLVQCVRGCDGKKRYPVYAKLGNLSVNYMSGCARRDFVQSATNRIDDVLQGIRNLGRRVEDRDNLRDRLVTNLSEKVDQLLAVC
jgi:hypothetical protein